MTHSIKLIVDEPASQQFVWTLLETEPDGSNPLILRSAGDPVDSYELALASGQRALQNEIRNRAAAAAHDAHPK
jgi:hypothetical protein